MLDVVSVEVEQVVRAARVRAEADRADEQPEVTGRDVLQEPQPSRNSRLLPAAPRHLFRRLGRVPHDTKHFAPSEHSFMVNCRVDDPEAWIAALKSEGVEVVGEIEPHENGELARILDPEGRKIELWEPVPSKDDPYL